jgi:mono/diheme cytochrome c family protein
MRALLRWIGIALGCLIVLVIAAYAVVFGLSERILRHTYDVPAVSLTVPTDPESIEEGHRLAVIRGCFGGCHGKQAEGQVFFDDPIVGRVVAPNLTAAVHRYTDAQIANIVRNGLRPDGRSVIVMPSEAFVGMNDADLGRVIAFMKSLPPADGPAPEVSVGPLGRIGLITGKFRLAAQLIADTVPPPAAPNEEAERGRYLARSICAECHGTSLQGDANPDFTSPDLRIVAAYSADAFTRLLRTGVPSSERELVVMGDRARTGLSHLTDPEIAALYTYLHAL